jgi:hypothetical protein
MTLPHMKMFELGLVLLAAGLLLCAAIERAHVAHTSANVMRGACPIAQMAQKNGVPRALLPACPRMEML